jgi:hypothetical protein
MAKHKLDSVYKNQVVSSDGVKKKIEYQGIPIHLDRPKGLIMTGKNDQGEDWVREYHYDYGFFPGTLGGDGDGVDVFVGPDKEAPEAYWAIQLKKDGSFDEFKVFLGFHNRDAAIGAFKQHIPQRFLGGMVTVRLDILKALIGVHPTGEFVKAASAELINRGVLFQSICFTHHLQQRGYASASP